MAISAADITRVRNLADASVSDFDDDAIEYSIALFSIRDADGAEPAEDDWVETYDLYRAAADIVEQRAAKVATRYDTAADGATLHRSQLQAQLTALAARLLTKARPRVSVPTLPDEDESEDDES
jgi:hypothetical protein